MRQSGVRWRSRIIAALLVLPVAICTASAETSSRAAQEAKPPPNVVIIFADDLGFGDLGCYGHERFQTPHIDRLAGQGVRLTQFHVPVPYCAPSRATLLTGRYPWRNGVMRNPAPDAGIHDVGIADEEVLLSEVLKDAGYATMCVGKWHLGHRPQHLPTRHGFDAYVGILYSNDMRPVELIAAPGVPRAGSANAVYRQKLGPDGSPREGHTVIEYPVVQALLTKRYTDLAVRFIEQNRERPFFLYLPHAMPHKPLAASDEFYQKTGAGLYGDVIAELDWSVGKVLAALDEHGLAENTLVIFASDNGPWFGGSTAGLRGMKGKTWEGGIRVPGIARWPGRVPAGRVSDELCGSIDVFPTVLAACGLKPPADRQLDGRNILPVLRGEAGSPHAALFAMQGGNLMTVRSGRWKLHVRSPGPSRYREDVSDWVDPRAPDGVTILAQYEQPKPDEFPGVHSGVRPQPMMLFDLQTDPAEQRNLADEHPEVVRRLKAQYDEMDESFRATPRAQSRR